MRRRRLLAVASLVLVLAVAAISVLLPGFVASVAPSTLVPPPDARSEAAAVVLPAVAVGAFLAAAFATTRTGTAGASVSPIVDRSVEAGDSDAVATVGRRFRQQARWAANEWQHAGGSERPREFAERLRDVATRAYADATGVDEATARDAVASGTWTDDRVAAWFLASRDASVPVPLSTWIWMRLRPSATYRDSVEHAAAAIDDLRGDD